ncbi:MAG: fibrobacter succinogenes major paralogous domain-containing protein [Bacteroidales bacterium]|nr:fibrobacter succinogenes major paralogous domain-containing protein [Bacteroidales bacterium]
MRTHFTIFFVVVQVALQLQAQVAINTDGSQPDASAILDAKSTTKGFLPPRMTHVQMYAIQNPATGLVVFCIDCGANNSGSLALYMADAWWALSATCIIPPAPTAATHVPSPNQIVWNWNTVAGATGYMWNTTNDYGTATDMGTVTYKTETGLNCGTSYTRYLWAYNNCGGSAPSTILAQMTQNCPFSCGQLITDARDGKTYNTVLIGSQCWMAHNLNIGARINGSQNQSNDQLIEKYCYNDLESNCDIYGGLYQWNEAMQYVTTPGVQGICPEGWYLPTDAEWTTLTTFLGGESIAGGALKETGTTHWASPNTGATNSSGFTALPGGFRYTSGSFYNLTLSILFWSSSEYSASNAWYREIFYDEADVGRGNYNKIYGIAVRCVK